MFKTIKQGGSTMQSAAELGGDYAERLREILSMVATGKPSRGATELLPIANKGEISMKLSEAIMLGSTTCKDDSERLEFLRFWLRYERGRNPAEAYQIDLATYI